MDTSHSILRFAKRFFAGTLLSRISGAMRDMAMAFCFGASPFIAAFMVAYRLANFFRRFFGEGNMQAGFVPHFETLSEKEAFYFYRDTSFTMLVLLIAVVFGMEAFLGLSLFYANAEWAQIAGLSMWMVPGLIFICLYALNSALLQARKSFFIPAAAPVLFNIAWIVAAFATHHLPIAEAVHWLSLGIILAFALQWALTAVQVRKHLAAHLSWSEWFRPRLFSPEWKKLLAPLSLGIVGVGAVQINTVLDAIFARIADPSGPAFLWYALRVQQLPLALFGLALSRALLPPLARAMRTGAIQQYRQLLQNSLHHATALMVPCTFALFALGPSGLNLLFGRGDFTPSDLVQTVHCLWGYGLGLIPSAYVLLLASGFYANKQYSAPTIASLAAVAINALLNALFIFVFHWGALSIAVATSLAALGNVILLLKRTIGEVFPPDFKNHFSRLALAGTGALGCTLFSEHFLGQGSRYFHEQLLEFLRSGVVYGASFLGIARALRVWESVKTLIKN